MHPMLGSEFDWLATDAGGLIGMFSSAGYGAVPLAAATRPDELDAAIDTIRAWPRQHGFIDETDGAGDFTDWFELASRGLYAYDWKHWDGPYERVASPTDPVRGDELPPAARTAACLVRFRGSFASTRFVAAPKATFHP